MRIKFVQKIIDKIRNKKPETRIVPFGRGTVLREIHNVLKPKLYLEIGIRDGYSLICANSKTNVIGIDPNPIIAYELSSKTKIFKETSDDFFKNHDIEQMYKQKIDLAFIDGMHLFDFVLRDFINVEKHSRKDSVILLHDTMPIDAPSATRISTEESLNYWTGDVYKIVLILKEYRPDLKIYNFDVPKSGLCIVKNLNPDSTVLQDKYDEIMKKYMDYSFEYIQDRKTEVLDIKHITNETMRERLTNVLKS